LSAHSRKMFKTGKPYSFVRHFYDMIQMEDAYKWAERLGFYKIFTANEWAYVKSKKELKRARTEGQIPVILGDKIEKIKGATWAIGALVDVQTKMDMQAAHIMKDKGMRAMYTLDWIRERPENIRFAAKGIRILHKARVPVLLATGAKDVACLKAPRDIAAVGVLMGMSVPMAYAAISTNWEGLM